MGERGAFEGEFHGTWWVAGRPEDKVGGVLRLSPGEVGDLRLYGTFESVATGEQVRILGTCVEHGAITLENAVHEGRSFRQPDYVYSTFRVAGALVGAHLNDPSAARFGSAIFQFASLGSWLRLPYPDSGFPDEGAGEAARHSMALEPPSVLTAVVPGLGRVEVGAWPNASWEQGRGELSLHPYVLIEFEKSQTLAEIWECSLSPLMFFMSLATGSPEKLVSAHLVLEGDSREDQIRWLDWNWLAKRSDEVGGAMGNPFISYADVERRFSDVLTRWFRLVAETRSPIESYFAAQLPLVGFFDDVFSRVVGAMETWHRTMHDWKPLPKEEFKRVIGSVKSVLTPAEWNVVADRVSYANQPTLRERLNDLTGRAGSELEGAVMSLPDFTGRVVRSRNGLAHDSAIGENFNHVQIPLALELLRLLFDAVLARELGFSEVEVAEMIKRSRRFARLVGPDSALRGDASRS